MWWSGVVMVVMAVCRAGWSQLPITPGKEVLPTGLESSPLTEVTAVVGGRTLLPCNITASTPDDAPILVLFYNGATGTPIYSIDARSGPLARSVHWSELGTRAHFDVTSQPQGLVLDSVEPSHQGHYRCRVDFRSSPTRNLRVKLMVVVPPGRVSIQSSSGVVVSGVIGPYPVGSSLTLTCLVSGGSPRPRVSWWHEGSLMDDVVEEVTGQVTRNILTLPDLTRQHLYRVLTCQAENSNLTMPLAATVTLDLYFPPLEVKILGRNSALSEGERYSLVCEAGGSRPPADLSWFLDGVLMTDTKDQVLQEGNVSRSTLHLVPSRKHHGAILSCRADNSKLPAAALEDPRKLIVYFAPKLQLRAGQNLDINNIKEGDDVYFECNIEANPSVFRVQWFLNGVELQQNVSAGVIQSNQSLVLQQVGRSCSGLYTCRAINMQGSDSSNAIQLNIKYAPVCAAGQKWVYGGGRQQPVNVTCRVEAHPEVTTFRWAFNTSSEYVQIPQDRVHSSRSRSVVAYTPQTHHDFGSLLCWGVNDVNMQEQPCVFHIVPAGVPEAVHNCSVWHNTSRAGEVVVACQEGWGGGLSQTFTLEVREAVPQGEGPPSSESPPAMGRVLAALRHQSAPHFTVTGLAPGTQYHLAVVAANAQGHATPTVLVHHTPIDVAEKRMSAAAAGPSGSVQLVLLTPIVGVVVGVVASLLLCLVVVVVIVRSRGASRGRHTKILYDDAGATCDHQQQQQQKPGPDIILVKDVKTVLEEKAVTTDYRSEGDGSFYINPGSLLSNGVLVTRETDALLQDPAVRSCGGLVPSTTTSFHLPPPPPATPLNPTITFTVGPTSFQRPTSCRSPSGPQECPQDLYLQKLNCNPPRRPSFQHPLPPSDSLVSFTSQGRGSPPVTSPVSCRSPTGPQKSQDLFLHKLSCEAVRQPLITSGHTVDTSHESSV